MMTAYLGALLAFTAALSFPANAQTAAYPDRTVRIVVPYAVGGYADTFARLVAAALTPLLGRPVIVENKPGANGAIGSEHVAKAAPDGYTLLMGGVNTHSINVSLYANLPFDPVADFTPVAFVVAADSLLVVNPSINVSTVDELLALARAQPGRLTHGSGGLGTYSHLSIELLKAAARVDMTHVAYKGEGESLAALLRGDIALATVSVATASPQVKSGKLRALATTGTSRSPAFPDLPTVGETLPGASAISWIGLFGPARLPPAIVLRINHDVEDIMRSSEMKERLSTMAAASIAMTPGQFAAFQKAEIAKWAEVIRKNRIKVE